MFSYKKEQVFREDYIERQFCDVFILRKNDLKAEDIIVQESEVEQVKFVDISELNAMMKNKNELVERDEIYKEIMNYLFRV